MLRNKLIAYREANPNTWVKKIDDIVLVEELTNHPEYKELPLHEKAAAIILGNAPRCECGSVVKFSGRVKDGVNGTLFGGWAEFCSTKCARTSSKTVQKRQQTTLDRYGQTSWAKTEDARKLSSVAWSEEKRAKFNDAAAKTYMERYGVTHFSKTKEYLEKRTATILETTGGQYTNHFQNVAKIKQATLEKYGVASYNKLPESRIRLSEFSSMKDPKVRLRAKFNRMSSRSVYSDELLAILSTDNASGFAIYVHALAKKHGFTHRKQISDELQISYTYLNALFRKFGMSEEYLTLGTSTSFKERKIYDYVASLGVQVSSKNRSIIAPKELDIVIESHKLAIEFDGIYYHSEYAGGKDKTYHSDKMHAAEAKGYALLHIFENEWDDPIKQEIWKSIIKSKLGLVSNKIHGRKCELVPLTPSQARTFFEKNHLSGFIGAEVHLGLTHNGVLVSALSYGKSRFSKNETELYRFASKLDHQVIGALGKFIKFIKCDNLVTYADRRISGVSSAYGKFFSKREELPPTWWGFKQGVGDLKHRLSYTKSKLRELLPNYDQNKSAETNMFENGYDRIWDCGNWKFSN